MLTPSMHSIMHLRSICSSADTHFYRGTALLALSRFEDALHSFDQALFIDNGHALAHYHRAFTLMKLGRHGRAIDCIRSLYCHHPPVCTGALPEREGAVFGRAEPGLGLCV